MKNTEKYTKSAGFTLVEILTVVAIIAILISILVPVLARQKINAKAKLARLDCYTIAQAIDSYQMKYIGKNPIGKNLGLYSGGVTLGGDITFGGKTLNQPSNADIMIILSALGELGGNQVNKGHVRNPGKRDYLKAKLTNSKDKPGMGPDGIYRDPFNNPYVITIDNNGDNKCWDYLYANKQVSGPGGEEIGAHGLIKESRDHDSNPDTPDIEGYVKRAKVMVWSAGPDREVSDTDRATAGKNQDNIVGFQ